MAISSIVNKEKEKTYLHTRFRNKISDNENKPIKKEYVFHISSMGIQRIN